MITFSVFSTRKSRIVYFSFSFLILKYVFSIPIPEGVYQDIQVRSLNLDGIPSLVSFSPYSLFISQMSSPMLIVDLRHKKNRDTQDAYLLSCILRTQKWRIKGTRSLICILIQSGNKWKAPVLGFLYRAA